MTSTAETGVAWKLARERLPWVLLLVVAGAELWPALRPVHVEGFSASIVALGLQLRQGAIHDFMPFAAFNEDYFGLTKLGAVYGVAALSPLFGGDGAFRLEMWLGAAFTLAGSADLIRRWSGTSWWVAGAALLLIPGVAESFYFLNDNVPAVGLLVLALALWARWPTYPAAILVGVLIGYAVTIRVDTALVATAAVPLIALEQRTFRQMVPLTAVAGLVAIAVLWAAFAFVHSTPLDALRAGQIAVKLWDWDNDPLRQMLLSALYLGLPALLLAVLGALRFTHERRWLRLAFLAGVPLLVCLVLENKMREVRQFLALTPFIGALVALGVQTLIDDWRRGQRVGPVAILAIALIWIVAPARGAIMTDGPRVLAGRIADLRLWSSWQQSMRDDFRRIDEVVGSARPDETLAVVTDGWNDDRYLHLTLVENGFRRVDEPAACKPIGEAMAANGRTVVELAVHQSFLRKAYIGLEAPRLERRITPCLAALRPTRMIMLGDRLRLNALLAGDAPVERPPPVSLEVLARPRIVAIPLDARSLVALDRGYRQEAIATGVRQQDVDAAIAMTRSQTPFSRQPGLSSGPVTP